jgi:hypothetical protein
MALATTTYLLNRRPSSSVGNKIPHQLLHGSFLEYSHLRVFGYLCYPNLSATTPDEPMALQVIQFGSFSFDTKQNVMKAENIDFTATMPTSIIFGGANLSKEKGIMPI